MQNETEILQPLNYRFDLDEATRRFLNEINQHFDFSKNEAQIESYNIESFLKWEDIRALGTPFMPNNKANLWLLYFTETYNTVVKHKEELAVEGLSYSDIIAKLEKWFRSGIKINTDGHGREIKEHFEGYIDPQSKIKRMKEPIGIPLDADVDIADNNIAKNVADEICAIKIYFAERYLLSDVFKKKEMTLLYLGITELSDEEKAALKKVTDAMKDTMLDKYITSVFNIEPGETVHDLTFGNKGISARMKKYFSLDYRNYPDDPDARINCIKLMAYLKGCEFKYGNELKNSNDSVKEKQNFYLNKLFENATADHVHTSVQSSIFSRAVTDIIFDVRKALDFSFVLRCEDTMKKISESVQKLIIGNIAETNKAENTDTCTETKEETFSVIERFYMFMILLEKRLSLDRILQENELSSVLTQLSSRKDRINGGWLYRQGVILSSEECKINRNIREKAPAKLGSESAPYDNAAAYASSSFMIRANDNELDFKNFFIQHLNGLVYFLCEDEDPEAQHKYRRRIKENLNNVEYLVKCLYGNRANMLSVYLCFFLYFSLGNANLEEKGYHRYDTKTLLRKISSRKLSDTEIQYLSTVVSEMVKRVMLNDGTGDIDKITDTEVLQGRIERFKQILTSSNIFDAQKKLLSLSG